MGILKLNNSPQLTHSNGVITGTIPSLAVNDTRTFKYTVLVGDGDMNEGCNLVEVDSDQNFDDEDNHCIAPPTGGDPILDVEKTANTTTANVGDNVNYTITVKNNHPTDTLTNIELTDTLPVGLVWASQDSGNNPQLVHSNGTITVKIASLAVGATETFKYTINVQNGVMDNACNIVTVDDDANHTDDDDHCITPPITGKSFELVKSANPL